MALPPSIKQQRSQTVQNYISYINDFYDDFNLPTNSLELYYPMQVQKYLQKRKNPANQMNELKVPMSKAQSSKMLQKMRMLSRCQANFMQVVFQKIDRRSKPIKKQEKLVSQSLKKKKIFLEQENYDILQLLQKNSKSHKAGDVKTKVAEVKEAKQAAQSKSLLKPSKEQQQFMEKCLNMKEEVSPIQTK